MEGDTGLSFSVSEPMVTIQIIEAKSQGDAKWENVL